VSQVQALLTATDQALDALTAYQRELEDVRAHLAFVLRSLDQAVQRALWAAGQRLSVLEGSENDDALRLVARRIEALGALQMELAARLPDLEQQLAVLYDRCREGSALALRHTAEYARKLNALPRPANGPPRVVVVDARRHPASAQHITAAVNMGAPETVTLDRSTVRSNRTGNLRHKPPRREYDRDEYPCAVFREGAGADVAYIPRGDNRGSGSSICHQLRGVPNGARVRVRVIW
jgi:ABC-type transporter Mla subunit MlaD